jgi:hypothetical protein
VPVFVKQLGAYPITDNANILDWPECTHFSTDGKSFASGRVQLEDKKGGDILEFPDSLRIREFPKHL